MGELSRHVLRMGLVCLMLVSRFSSVRSFLQVKRSSFPAGAVRRLSSQAAYDPEQARLMDAEHVIAVSADDEPLRPVSKRDSHLNKYGPVLHRAFSVFLFDGERRLLLQKRADSKITFPKYWTNTCCSHPLWGGDEMGKNIDDAVMGCKRAAIRKLEHELGIPSSSMSPDDLVFVTRIHYIADSSDEWGEHELDYLFVARKPHIHLQPNPNEVGEVRWVNAEELKALIQEADEQKGIDGGIRITPWSKAIIDDFLFSWWRDLDQIEGHVDLENIHRVGRIVD